MIEGKVIDSALGDGVSGITLQNLTLKTSVTSGTTGEFALEAAFGSRIQVSGTGFRTRFITIQSQPLSPLSISLSRQSTMLAPVVVNRRRVGYAADSAERHATYARALARQRGGSIMSPVTFLAERLSRRSRQMFRFQEEFETMEEQRFIDTRYTPQLTASLTHLSGDTLAYFMNAYPMPADLARDGSDLELKMWIRWSYKKWLDAGSPIPHITADSTLSR